MKREAGLAGKGWDPRTQTSRGEGPELGTGFFELWEMTLGSAGVRPVCVPGSFQGGGSDNEIESASWRSRDILLGMWYQGERAFL